MHRNGKYGLVVLVALIWLCLTGVANCNAPQMQSNASENITITILGNGELGENISLCELTTSGWVLTGEVVTLAATALEQSGYKTVKKCSGKPWNETVNDSKSEPNTMLAGAFWNWIRANDFNKSDPVGKNDTIVIYTLNGSGIVINDVDDLQNHTVGTTSGDSYGDLIDKMLSALNTTREINATACIVDLLNKKFQCYIGSEQAIDPIIEKMGLTGLINKSTVIIEIPFYCLFPKDSPVDLELFNKNMAAAKASAN